MRGGEAKDLKQNDQKERSVVETLNQGQACSPVLIAKLIQIGFVLNTGPEASK